MVQAFLNQAVFGMDPQSACEAPRFASYSWPSRPLPHSYLPGVLRVERDIGEAPALRWRHWAIAWNGGRSANTPRDRSRRSSRICAAG